jgi:trans-o-hydroxybenzylidenepyruvate hydratase-aldolase
VSELPQVISAKIASAGFYLRDQRASKRKIRLMPIDAEFYAAARLDPDTAVAFWSSSASCGPAPAIALREFVEQAKHTGDWSQALTLSDKMTAAALPTICYGDWETPDGHGRLAACRTEPPALPARAGKNQGIRADRGRKPGRPA